MSLTRVQIADQIRSELNVFETDLPNPLLYDYLNQVQREVASMLGPVVEPFLRKRIILSGYSTAVKENDGAGTYTESTGVITGFTGLTPDAHINDEVLFSGTVTSEKAYVDIITDNDATTITIAKNSRVGGNGTSVLALIFQTPAELSPDSGGITLPDDCMRPLFLSDLTDPTAEDRIDIIQADQTELIRENTYYDSEVAGAFQVGDVVHLYGGDSATYPATTMLTYLRRPVDFTADADTLAVSEGRIPEEFFGVMRAGILKLAAMHLKRREEMQMAGEDMNARIQAIHTQWGLTQQFEREQEATR